MKIQSPKINPVIAGPTSLLVWITLVAVHFNLLLGAKVTMEWIIAGTVFSVGAFLILFVLHEIAEALGTPETTEWKPARETASRSHRALFGDSRGQFGGDCIDWVFVEQHRSDLGLPAREECSNRFR